MTLQAFRAIHTAYINLLRNPFYTPDEHSPHHPNAQRNTKSWQITSTIFIKQIDKIGKSWAIESSR